MNAHNVTRRLQISTVHTHHDILFHNSKHCQRSQYNSISPAHDDHTHTHTHTHSPCSFITHADGSCRGTVFSSVCLSVCLFFSTISRTPMQLGSPNLTQKCSIVSQEIYLLLGENVKGHGHQAQKNSAGVGFLHSCECKLLLV